jgi:Ras-related protein Rab-21
METTTGFVFKFVTLGEGRVGKSSLIVRYTQDAFDEARPPTMLASFVEKRLNIEATSVLLNLWDT